MIHRSFASTKSCLLIGLAIFWPVVTQPAQSQESTASVREAEARPVNRAAAYYHFSVARLLEESGNFLKAEAEYRKALEHDSQSSYLLTEVANAYLRNNRIPEAIERFEKAIGINDGNLRAHKLLGAIYHKLLEREWSGRRMPSGDTLSKAIREYEAIGRLAPQEANSLLVLGRLYSYAGRPDKAVAVLERSLEVTPSSEETLSMLGELYRDQNEMRRAVDLFEKALKLSPSSLALRLQLGLAYEQTGDFKKAVETYKSGMGGEFTNLTLLRKSLAHALMGDGQLDLAEKEYRKILELEPEDGESHLGLGKISLERHRYEEALEHLNKADALLQNNVEVVYSLAKLHEDLGRFEEAQEGYERMLNLYRQPGDDFRAVRNRSISLTHLGLVAQELGNYEKAAGHFQELHRLGEKYRGHTQEELKKLAKENRNRATILMIRLYRGSKRVSQALSTCKAAKESAPTRIIGALCADILAESGDAEQALQELEGMLKGNQEDLEIYHYILQVYQRQKRYKDAQKKLYEAEKYFDHEKSFYFMLGALQERQKEYGKAETTFRKVISLDPMHASALNYLGYMWADQGVKLNEALNLIKQAVALEPNNGAYLDSLGWVYFKLGRIEEAELYLVRALARVRRDPTIHDHLGDLYYKKGDYLQARSAWQRSVAYGQDEEESGKVRQKMADLDTKLALSAKDK